MSENIKVRRLKVKLNDFYEHKIDLTDLTRADKSNDFFTRALAAYSVVMKTGIDYEESAKHVVDGYNDLGVDLIYRDVFSKKLYLVQSKFYNNGNGSISQGDVLKFCSGIEKIMNGDVDDGNDKVKNKMQEVDEALNDVDYTICLIVVYTSDEELSNQAKQVLEKICEETNDPDNEIMKYEVIKLQNIYSALSNSIVNEINLENVEIDNWGCILEDEKLREVYGTVSASLIGKWWNDYKTAILSKNIRSFKGSTEVNQGMKKTLTETPENFIYFNNGIKIVADKIQRKGLHSTRRDLGLFDIKNASIVNGAQTVGCVGEVCSIDPSLLEHSNIFVQIVSLDGRNSEFGIDITKLSNTQNRIESKDFVGLHNDFHKRLKEDFALDGIGYTYKSGEDNTLFE